MDRTTYTGGMTSTFAWVQTKSDVMLKVRGSLPAQDSLAPGRWCGRVGLLCDGHRKSQSQCFPEEPTGKRHTGGASGGCRHRGGGLCHHRVGNPGDGGGYEANGGFAGGNGGA
jgi:hypothetical protein